MNVTATPAGGTKVVDFVQAINLALDEALAMDDRVFLLGEDIADPGGGAFRATRGLSTKYGRERVRDTPISEQAIIGAAIGAAIAGMRPVAEIMIMDFMGVCMDQLTMHAAKLRYMSGGLTTVPITVRTSAGAGRQSGAQHSEMLEAWFTHVPGLKVVVPSTPADARGLLLSCIFDEDPCIFVEQRNIYYAVKGPIPDDPVRVPLGVSRMAREGGDVTIVTYGQQVHLALEAAARLEAESISAEVIDLRTLVPLDEDAVLSSVRRTRRAVVLHEAVRRGGFGAELSALIGEKLYGVLASPIVRLGGKDTPIPYAKELEESFLPTVDDVLAAVRSVVRR